MTKDNASPKQTISDDYSLLKLMLDDVGSVPSIYKPGPYWSTKTKISANEIKRFGLNDFRGNSNNIATSYSDSIYIDVRHRLNYGIRMPFGFLLKNVYPFSHIFDSQVNLTRTYAQEYISALSEIASKSQEVKRLLGKYVLPSDNLTGGCINFCEIAGTKISTQYLEVLATHDTLAQHIDFSSAQSFFEIGGGYGVNLHILIENYKNLKKFVYLDIVPNLYVGTKYLECFYGKSVISYRETRNLKNISFSNNNELEIICIAPHQIERLELQVDIFQNSHSFVEMPKAVVRNYAIHIERMLNLNKSAIALVSYDGFDLNTTFHPDELPQFFSQNFEKHENCRLMDPHRINYHYISNAI